MNTPTQVETYSSYAYAVEPRAFAIEGARHAVAEVLRAWKTPGQVHFRVRDEHERLFELIYDEMNDQWGFCETPHF